MPRAGFEIGHDDAVLLRYGLFDQDIVGKLWPDANLDGFWEESRQRVVLIVEVEDQRRVPMTELLTCRILTGDQFVNKAQVGAGENRGRRVEVLAEFLRQMIRRGVGQMVERNGEGPFFLVGKQIGLGGKNLT